MEVLATEEVSKFKTNLDNLNGDVLVYIASFLRDERDFISFSHCCGHVFRTLESYEGPWRAFSKRSGDPKEITEIRSMVSRIRDRCGHRNFSKLSFFLHIGARNSWKHGKFSIIQVMDAWAGDSCRELNSNTIITLDLQNEDSYENQFFIFHIFDLHTNVLKSIPWKSSIWNEIRAMSSDLKSSKTRKNFCYNVVIFDKVVVVHFFSTFLEMSVSYRTDAETSDQNFMAAIEFEGTELRDLWHDFADSYCQWRISSFKNFLIRVRSESNLGTFELIDPNSGVAQKTINMSCQRNLPDIVKSETWLVLHNRRTLEEGNLVLLVYGKDLSHWQIDLPHPHRCDNWRFCLEGNRLLCFSGNKGNAWIWDLQSRTLISEVNVCHLSCGVTVYGNNRVNEYSFFSLIDGIITYRETNPGELVKIRERSLSTKSMGSVLFNSIILSLFGGVYFDRFVFTSKNYATGNLGIDVFPLNADTSDHPLSHIAHYSLNLPHTEYTSVIASPCFMAVAHDRKKYIFDFLQLQKCLDTLNF